MSMRPLIQTETGLSTGSELQCQTEKPSVEHQYSQHPQGTRLKTGVTPHKEKSDGRQLGRF